jgi:hypothetical protein
MQNLKKMTDMAGQISEFSRKKKELMSCLPKIEKLGLQEGFTSFLILDSLIILTSVRYFVTLKFSQQSAFNCSLYPEDPAPRVQKI